MNARDLSHLNLAGLSHLAKAWTGSVPERSAVEQRVALELGPPPEDGRIELDDIVACWGTGNLRLGRVVKLGPKRITVAYRVPSTGRDRTLIVPRVDVFAHQSARVPQ